MAQIKCKYHPETPAAWHCESCDINYCGSCVPAEERAVAPACPVCKRTLDYLGAGNLITPFWQNIAGFYRYPLARDPLLVILGLALASSLVGLVLPPLEIIAPVILFILFIRYATMALEETARGNMDPPPLESESLLADLELAFMEVFLIIFVVTANMVVNAWSYFALAPLMLVTILALPAAIMVLAIERRFVQILNPVYLWQFIQRIGVHYLLLCAFLLLLIIALSATVGVLGMFAPDFLITFFVTAITMYFVLVMFHMMGYVIYQYHEELQFEVIMEAPGGEEVHAAPPRRSVPRPNTEVLLNEGKIEQARNELEEYVRHAPGDLEARSQLHRLLRATRDTQALCRHADDYLQRLLDDQQASRAQEAYIDCLKQDREYRPENVATRLALARLFRSGTHSRLVLHLLNGLHRSHPQHQLIPEAYLLVAQVMCERFGEYQKAKKILNYVLSHYPDSSQADEVRRYLSIVEKVH